MKNHSENQNNEINQTEYFRQMKNLALLKRAKYGINSEKIDLNQIKRIYKEEEIILDYQDIKSNRIRAAYFCDEVDCSVLSKKSLPRVPKIFSLIHELKHHFADREKIIKGEIVCGDYNENELIEVGAEVFAAEFIFPETEMFQSLTNFGISKETVTPKKVIEYKRGCGVPVSYKFIEKRLEWFRIIDKGDYSKIQFQKLENELFPNPFKRTKKKSKVVS